MSRAPLLVVLVALLTHMLGADGEAQPRFGVNLEGAAVWLGRNDVRIPPEGGTEFSLSDLIDEGVTPTIRAESSVDFNERHGVRLTYAPFEASGAGTPATAIVFDDATFAPGVTTDGLYKFSSYRATYRYRFYQGERWTWRVGATAFVRDAKIRLEQPGVSAEYPDVGFVPLAHVDAEVRLSDAWRLVFDLDGSAAPQGRAFDALAKVVWRPTQNLDLGLGYRTIEGGADVDEVYNFAWLQFAVASVGVRF